MAEGLKDRIMAATKKRVRGGMVLVGEERFAVEFRVYPAAEIEDITKRIRESDNATGAAILAEQILDPADHRPVFTGEEIEAMPNVDMVALLNAFMRANLGGASKN